MATSFYVDNVLGDDDNTGLVGFPWATLAKASLAASYGAASTPWTINITDNGWANPYLYETQTALIKPDFSGSAGNPHVWNCNFAPMVPATELTGKTWARLPGTSNVYYCANTTSVALGMYGWDDTTGDIMIYNGRHYHARLLELATKIPNDWEDHCFYHNTTENILYWCDKSGPPATSGVRFAYRGSVSGSVNTYNTSQRTYHTFNNPHFYGGKYDANTGYCVTTSVGASYAIYNRGYMLYGGPAGVGILGIGDEINYCVLVDNWSARTIGNGCIRLLGANGNEVDTKIYNTVLLRGTPKAVYFDDYARVDMQNSAILDSPILVGFATANKNVIENNNFFGLSRLGAEDQTQLIITPDATDVWVEGDSGYSVANFKDRDATKFNLRPLGGSGVIDKGADLSLTTDIDGNSVPKGIAPEIGAYEVQFQRRSYIYYNYA